MLTISQLTARVSNLRALYARYGHTRHAHRVATQTSVLSRLVGDMLRSTRHEGQARILRRFVCLLHQLDAQLPRRGRMA